jgi:hypothetical protein
MSYEEIVQQYPCPDRRGMGYTGCTCTNNYRQDPRFVDCAAYWSKTTRVENCINCQFRMQHDAKKRQLNG